MNNHTKTIHSQAETSDFKTINPIDALKFGSKVPGMATNAVKNRSSVVDPLAELNKKIDVSMKIGYTQLILAFVLGIILILK